MTISQQLKAALRFGFAQGNTDIVLDSNKIDRSLVATTSAGTIFVPTIYAESIVRKLRFLGTSFRGDIVIPLTHPYTMIKKTSDSIISALFRYSNSYGRTYNIGLIDTEKGYKYYGGKGLILDENFIPLLVCGYEVTLTSIVDGGYKYGYPTCIINPSVFNREDMVSKAIVKKVIPFYTSENLGMMRDSNGIMCSASTVKLIITPEIINTVHTITPPSGIDVDDDIYALLNAHINEIRV